MSKFKNARDQALVKSFQDSAVVRNQYVALYYEDPKSKSKLHLPEGVDELELVVKNAQIDGILVVAVGSKVEDLEPGDRVRVSTQMYPHDSFKTEHGGVSIVEEMHITAIIKNSDLVKVNDKSKKG